MSIINRVLKDLDQKGSAPSMPAGVQAVQSMRARSWPHWPWLLVLCAGTIVAAWLWLEREPQPSATATTPLPDPPAPASILVPPALPVPVPAMPADARMDANDSPAPRIETTARQDSVAARGVRAERLDIPPTIKLDRSLPKLPSTRVIKEIRPPSLSEQAEERWRQATVLIDRGRGEAARQVLADALQLDPTHAAARQTLIALCEEAGDTLRSEALLREGMRLHPGEAWYHRGLAQLLLQGGDATAAATMLKAGLGKNVDPDYWSHYASLLGHLGQPAEAAQAWQQTVNLDPANGRGWIGLAISLEHSGKRSEAAAAYQRALQTPLSAELRAYAENRARELLATSPRS